MQLQSLLSSESGSVRIGRVFSNRDVIIILKKNRGMCEIKSAVRESVRLVMRCLAEPD